MLRKSPAWDENLQAVVINGTRTHNPDYQKVEDLALVIFRPHFRKWDYCVSSKISKALNYFIRPNVDSEIKQSYIEALESLAPNAYHK